jgi:hypothetical protein
VRRNVLDAGLTYPRPSSEQIAVGRFPASLARMIGQALAIDRAGAAAGKAPCSVLGISDGRDGSRVSGHTPSKHSVRQIDLVVSMQPSPGGHFGAWLIMGWRITRWV